MTTKTKDLPIKVEEFTNIIQTAPDILNRNKTSVTKCNDAGKALLDTVEANGEIDSDELDQTIAGYIEKTKITVKRMNERRSPFTQFLRKVTSEFTSLENEINPTNQDSIAAKLQNHRNKYIGKKLAIAREQEELARRKRVYDNEKNEYRTELPLSLEKHYSRYFDDFSARLIAVFNSIDLENFEDKAAQIEEFSTVYPAKEHFSKFLDTFRAVYLTEEDKGDIKKSIVPNLMQSCTNRYKNDMQALKEDLLLKLPSRKRELEEIEELKKKDAEAAKRAEKEAKKREEEEAKKREEERKKREAEEKARLEAKAAQEDLFNEFNKAAEAIPTTTPDAKVTKKIKVNNPKGFLEIYQMWFLAEGMDMSIPDLEKVHRKMITFCEKKANKDNEFIKSAFVEYIDDIKAK